MLVPGHCRSAAVVKISVPLPLSSITLHVELLVAVNWKKTKPLAYRKLVVVTPRSKSVLK